jgi:hypothetical protein
MEKSVLPPFCQNIVRGKISKKQQERYNNESHCLHDQLVLVAKKTLGCWHKAGTNRQQKMCPLAQWGCSISNCGAKECPHAAI